MSPSTSQPPAATKRASSLKAQCISVLVIILTVACIGSVVALCYFSMTPEPTILAQVLTGNWTVERVSPSTLTESGGGTTLSRGAQLSTAYHPKMVSFDFSHEYRKSSVKRALSDKMSLESPFDIMGHTISGNRALEMHHFRSRGNGWFWTGPCSNADHCSLLYHEMKFVFTAFNSSVTFNKKRQQRFAFAGGGSTTGTGSEKQQIGRETVAYVLMPTHVKKLTVWEKKGTYVSLLVVVIIVVMKLKNILVPGKKQMRLDQRLKQLEHSKRMLAQRTDQEQAADPAVMMVADKKND